MTTTNEDFITVSPFVSADPTYTGNITIIPTGLGYPEPIRNIILNNTFRVPYTEYGEKIPVASQLPYMELKDQEDGKFRQIYINSNTVFAAGSELIRRDDLENIINEDQIIFSNIYIDAYNVGNSYINFLTSASNAGLPPQIGFRVSNGFIEYLHKGETWSKVGSTTETFPTEMYLVSPGALTQYVAVPPECAGVRLKVVGGGGWGGNAAIGLFSQGAGGGSGGFVDCFLTEDDLLNCANIKVDFQPSIAPYGSNVAVAMQRTNGTLIQVANATGGFPGMTVSLTPTGSIDGGEGGSGSYTYVTANQGYPIPGGTGETGFWSEPQNLRYYSGGVGADSQLGTGGTGASTSAAAGTAYYGGGGGGGLFVPQGMFNPPTATIPASNISYPGGAGGNPAVLIEFWINAEPWNSNTGGGGPATSYFKNLLDVSVSNVAANRYLKYINELAINQSLDIVDDTTPQLGGNLALNGYNLVFPTANTGLVDSAGNLAVVVSAANTNISYLVLKASTLPGGEPAGEITVDSQLGALDPDVSLAINSKGNGDIQLATGASGVIQLAAGQLSIDNTSVVEITSGYMTLASSYLTDADLSTNNTNPAISNAATTSSFLVIECSSGDQRYYLDLTDGAPGQILNIVYDCPVANTEVRLGFRDTASPPFTQKQVGIGSGLVPALRFAISGQSSQLAYIDMQANPGRSRWQVLNSGAFTSS
jgi:hypothetical protein